MRSTLTRILSFGALEAGGRGFNWLLLAILPVFIGPEEYGMVGLIAALEFVLASSLIIGQDRVVLRFYHDKAFDRGALLTTSLVIVSATAVAFLVFVASLAAADVRFLFRIPVSPELVLLALLVLIGQFSRLTTAFARVETNSVLFGIHRLGLSLLKFSLVLVGVRFFGGVESYLIGAGLATILALAAGAPFLRNRLSKFDWQLCKRWVSFGWPFVFHAGSAGLLMFADRYMIDYFLGTSAVGIYTLSYSIGASVVFVFATLIIYIEPQVYKAGAGSRDSEKWLAILGACCVFVGSIVGAFIVMTAGPVIELKLRSEYTDAVDYIPIIIAAHLVMVIYLQSSFRLTAQKRTGIIAVCSAAAAVANIILNVIMIPKYGILGAAIATFISYLVLSITTHVASLYRQQVQFSVKSWFLLVVITFGSSLVAFAGGPIRTSLALAGIVVVVALLYSNDAWSAWASRQKSHG